MKKTADLFVVMNDDELIEAIDYAKENGATTAKVTKNISYEFKVNGLEMADYCKKTGNWFPALTDYIFLPTSNEDSIAILLSPTVWTDYDMNKVYKCLNDNNIIFDSGMDEWYDHENCATFKEEERQASIEAPINSPWTARDIEVVATAVTSIEGIKAAAIITGANVEINCFCWLLNGTPLPNKAMITSFNYPNVLHILTEEGYSNVFLGSDIDLEEVRKLIEEKAIDFEIVPYVQDKTELLFYQPRGRTRKT